MHLAYPALNSMLAAEGAETHCCSLDPLELAGVEGVLRQAAALLQQHLSRRCQGSSHLVQLHLSAKTPSRTRLTPEQIVMFGTPTDHGSVVTELGSRVNVEPGSSCENDHHLLSVSLSDAVPSMSLSSWDRCAIMLMMSC